MPDPTTFGLFVVAALALLLVPGPAVFYVVARGVEGGRLVGLVSCLGIEVGTLAHAAFAAVGLSALLASSATALAVVKWLGAAYLIWLGLKCLFGRGEEDAPAAVEPEPLSRAFSQGVIVQVSQPQGYAVLPGLFATVCGPLARRRVDADPCPRRDARRARAPDRRTLRAARRHGQRSPQAEERQVPPCAAILLRRSLPGARRGERGLGFWERLRRTRWTSE